MGKTKMSHKYCDFIVKHSEKMSFLPKKVQTILTFAPTLKNSWRACWYIAFNYHGILNVGEGCTCPLKCATNQ